MLPTESPNGHTYSFLYALDAANLGIPVFPIRDKQPPVSGGFYQATADFERIKEWGKRFPNASIASPTGFASPQKLVVIDADNAEAVESLRNLFKREPDVWTRQGAHWYFRHPQRGKIKSGCIRKDPHIDRKADGGYVEIPPSPGKTWVNGIPDFDSLPVLPQQLVDAPIIGANGSKNGSSNSSGGRVDLGAILDGVNEGERDDALYKAACSLRARCYDKPVAVSYVRQAAQNANPPFDPDEAEEKVHRAYDQFPEGRTEAGKPTHDELRNRWLNEYRSYAYGQGEWKQYSAGIWQPVETETILDTVETVLVDAKPEGIKPTASLRASVADLARTKVFVSSDRWDGDPDQLVCQNGTLHIPTRQLRDHSPDDHATSGVPYAYDPDATAPAWERYLQTTLSPDVAAFFQEYAGYALTTDTRHELMLWLCGPRGSGKSTALEGLSAMLGERKGNIDLKGIDRSRFGLQNVKGKTLLVSTETLGGWFKSTHILNALVSGEPVTIERKHRDAFEITPTAKIAIATTDRPNIADPGDGIFRRVKVLEFAAREAGRRDPDLKEQIKTEGAGILNWALDGLARLQARGRFEIPASIEAASAEFQEENDVAGMFIQERCKTDPDLKTPAATLYAAYKYYCEDFGYMPKSARAVAKDWKRLGFNNEGKINGRAYWYGVQAPDPAKVETL